jgi:hypothetical protein
MPYRHFLYSRKVLFYFKNSSDNDLTEYINNIKEEYYGIKYADEITEQNKKTNAIEKIELFVEKIKLKYMEAVYVNNTKPTFEQLLKDSSDSSSPTNCTGSINNAGDVTLKNCIIDTFTCSYNTTDGANCK